MRLEKLANAFSKSDEFSNENYKILLNSLKKTNKLGYRHSKRLARVYYVKNFFRI